MWKWMKNFIRANFGNHPDSSMDCQEYFQELQKYTRN